MYAGFGYDPMEMPRGGRGSLMQRLDEYYRAFPIVMAPGPDRPELNYGSKIIVPASLLAKASKMHVQWPLALEIINGETGRHSHSGVLEFNAEEGKAYLPHWMMQTLGLEPGSLVQVKSTALELAKLVKLQPQSVAFLDISDPRAVLEKAFRNFAALTKGDVFNFEYNDQVFDVAVLDVKPETDKMGVSMIETDVEVDFAAPLGYVEPERVPRQAGPAGSGTSTPRGLPGVPAGGMLHSQGTMAAAINYDAIAPGAERARSSNFQGSGNKLANRKGAKATPPAAVAAAAAAPATASGGRDSPVAAGPLRRRNGPLPLRLPPNKLFFGYEITPVKTKEQKEAEAENAKKPHYFAGQGQSLRGAKKKDDPKKK